MDVRDFFARAAACQRCGAQPVRSLFHDGSEALAKIECVACRRSVKRRGNDIDASAVSTLVAWNDMNTDYE